MRSSSCCDHLFLLVYIISLFQCSLSVFTMTFNEMCWPKNCKILSLCDHMLRGMKKFLSYLYINILQLYSPQFIFYKRSFLFININSYWQFMINFLYEKMFKRGKVVIQQIVLYILYNGRATQYVNSMKLGSFISRLSSNFKLTFASYAILSRYASMQM